MDRFSIALKKKAPKPEKKPDKSMELGQKKDYVPQDWDSHDLSRGYGPGGINRPTDQEIMENHLRGMAFSGDATDRENLDNFLRERALNDDASIEGRVMRNVKGES